MSTYVKLARAVFLSGFVGMWITLATQMLWLGIVVALIIGYFAFDPKQAWQSIPKSFDETQMEAPAWVHFVLKRRPGLHFFLLFLAPGVYGSMLLAKWDLYNSAGNLSSYQGVFCVSILYHALITGSLFHKASEGEYCIPKNDDPTYSEVLMGAGKVIGICHMGVFIFAAYIVVGVFALCAYLVYFFSFLVWLKLALAIHSTERTICALDGALGVAVAYLLLVTPGQSIGVSFGIMFAAGGLGVGIGTANYRLIKPVLENIDRLRLEMQSRIMDSKLVRTYT